MADKKNKRILLLLLFLKRKGEKGASKEDIERHLSENLDGFSYSGSTFERDKNDLKAIWNVELIYDKKTNMYSIDEHFVEEQISRIMQEQWVLEALRENSLENEMILFEKRSPRSLAFFYDILQAISDKKKIFFDYFKYDTETVTRRKLMPYALKEFNFQWYLVGSETNDADNLQMKHFALDRIDNLEVKGKFKRHKFDVEAHFKNYFGIIHSDEPPVEISLRFDRQQGNYVKAQPWHQSQEIVKEDDNYLIVKLFLSPTYDFQQKICLLSDRVEVLSPEWFREQIKQKLEKTLLFYKKK